MIGNMMRWIALASKMEDRKLVPLTLPPFVDEQATNHLVLPTQNMLFAAPIPKPVLHPWIAEMMAIVHNVQGCHYSTVNGPLARICQWTGYLLLMC
jgi:hypothetical protein